MRNGGIVALVAFCSGLTAAPHAGAQVTVQSSFNVTNSDQLGMSIPRSTNRGFVTSDPGFGFPRIDAVDLASRTIVQGAQTEGGRSATVISPDERLLAKPVWSSASVVFHRTDDVRQRTEVPLPVPGTVYAVQFAPDGRMAYALGFDATGNAWLAAIDTTSLTPGPVLMLPRRVFFQPLFVVSPTAPVALVATLDSSIMIVDLAAFRVAVVVPFGGTPYAATFRSDGRSAWISSFPNTLGLLDSTAGTVVQTLTTGAGPGGVVVDETQGFVIVPCSGDQTIEVWDAASGMRRARIPVPGIAVAKMPLLRDVGLALVTARNPDVVHVVDVSAASPTFGTVIQTVPLPGCTGTCMPSTVVVDADETRGYVLSANRTQVDVLSLPRPPVSIALSPSAFNVSPGSALTFDVAVRNNSTLSRTVDAWFDVLRTNGTPFPGGPVRGPRSVTLSVGAERRGTVQLNVGPGSRRLGPLTLRARVGGYPGAVIDTSTFLFVLGP
ncbi:MAG: hypothetical protein HY292_22630 [Planctomycetes bacterium]|nr:hypothetical protein [Planctomycetota bacterium]